MLDEDDDCFGLWMVQDGALVNVSLPRTQRVHVPPPSWRDDSPDPGSLWWTDGPDAGSLPAHTPEHEQDPRLSWSRGLEVRTYPFEVNALPKAPRAHSDRNPTPRLRRHAVAGCGSTRASATFRAIAAVCDRT
jgi:hypothetical protein